jgi:hypothetical protein
VEFQSVCQLHLRDAELASLRKSIREAYYFEMTIDDLPVYGFVGSQLVDADSEVSSLLLHTHLHFLIGTNGDSIVKVKVDTASRPPVDITHPDSVFIEFSFSAEWYEESEYTLENRQDAYLEEESFFSKVNGAGVSPEVRWISVINSMVLVFLLTLAVGFILLRILRTDFVRFEKQQEGDELDDIGWKLVHGDVFRFPMAQTLLSAFLGVGSQFLTLLVALLLLGVFGFFHPMERGSVIVVSLLLFALTCGVAGYVSAFWYKRMGGTAWIQTAMVTASIFAGPTALVMIALDAIATFYASTAALPWTSLAYVVLLYLLISIPLIVVGSIFGRALTTPFKAPCRVKKVARLIPPAPWYRSAWFHITVGGFTPFSAIYIELYYLFVALWGREYYAMYEMLALVFVILVIVTSAITVTLTYFQLSAENYHWWWRSFLSGGATGLFILLCSFVLFVFSEMSGLLQTAFFIGYMLVISYAFFLALGTIGFFSALLFVSKIYTVIKSD